METDVGCEVTLMGGFGVRVDGRPVPSGAWNRRRAAELVKILALERSHRLHREQILEALWFHLAPAAAAANLRKAVHYARRALGSEAAIVSSLEMVELWPDGRVTVDAVRFERVARAALRANDPVAIAHAAALYEGELLPEDRYAPWAEEPRARLRLLALRVLKAASQWERVLEIDPADEEAHRGLMEQALASGDRIGAIRQFRQLRERLRIDVGMGPDEESVTLYERALIGNEHERPSVVERVWALLARGVVHLKSGDLDQAELSGELARSLATSAALSKEFGEASALLGIVANERRQWKEVFRSEFIDAVTSSRGIAASIFDAHLCIAEFCLFGLSDHREIVHYASELLQVARRSGSVQGRALAELFLGEGALVSDRLSSAQVHLTNAAEFHRQARAVAGHVITIQRLAELAVARGGHGQAGRLLRGGLRLADSSPMAPHLIVRMHEGLVGAATGLAERKVVEEAEASLDARVVCPPCSIGFKLAAAKAFARSGRADLARRRTEDSEQLARMWPGGPWHAAIWEARGETRRAQGDEQAASVMFREAAERFAEAGRPRDAARCRAASQRVGQSSAAVGVERAD
jgi:DNA-binding SARP family transcriptional activator